jgi:hypothetical protein
MELRKKDHAASVKILKSAWFKALSRKDKDLVVQHLMDSQRAVYKIGK